MWQSAWLPEFVEIYIRHDLHIELTRTRTLKCSAAREGQSRGFRLPQEARRPELANNPDPIKPPAG